MTAVFSSTFPLAVRSYEIDSYSHVNNGAYVNWYEEAREHLLKAGHRDYHYYPERHSAWLVVAHLAVDYLQQGKRNDQMILCSRLTKFGRTSVTWRQSVRRRDDQLCLSRARVVMVFTDKNGQPTPIPEDFRTTFSVHPGGDLWLADEGGEVD